MRHNRDEKRFDMNVGHLRCVMANMTNSLVTHGRIKTTTQRAKVLRKHVEKMITLGKSGSVHARRKAMAFMRDKNTVTRLFDSLAPLFVGRNGGYTRIMKLGLRAGDCAQMSIIELVEVPKTEAVVEPVAKKAPAKKPAVKKAAPKSETKAETKEKKPRVKKAAVEGHVSKPRTRRKKEA